MPMLPVWAVIEAPEGHVATLRTLFLKHWRVAMTAAYAATVQEMKGDGVGIGSASEGLPHSPGGRFVTPPTSP